MSNHRRLRLRLLSHSGTEQVCPRVTINKLPDEVLLEIFGFHMVYPLPPPSHKEDAWHTLVHVCQRWRHVVFGSPRRLELRLLCANRRLLNTLDIWPELPVIIHVDDEKLCQLPSVTNVIPVLKRNDRVCKVFIHNVPNSLLEELATVAGPFPALIKLELVSFKVEPPMLPDSFLGGSAPRLRSLDLWGISFPAVGKLLSSTSDLVTLSLGVIPESAYISPDAMVTTLSALTRLKTLHLIFEIPQFWIDGASQRPLVSPRVVLPALADFNFAGDCKYLENIVSRIDAPLQCIALTFGELVFDVPHLRDFICRANILDAPYRANTSFSYFDACISLFQRKGGVESKVLNLKILCDISDLQVSSLAQACSWLLPPLPSLEHLDIYNSGFSSSGWKYEADNSQWLDFLHLFITVKDLVLDKPFVLSVASALQGLAAEQATEILPVLQNIFLESTQSSGPVPEGIARFITARKLSGHPVIVHYQERKE